MSQAGRFITGSGAPVVETLTGNSGGPVGPDGAFNINVLGDTTTINIAGNPGTHTLTVSATGAVPISFPTDSGTATPAAGVLNIIAGNATQVCGSTVEFTGSGNTVQLNVTDAAFNTIIGKIAGNNAFTTANKLVGLGYGTFHFATSAENSVAVGYASLGSLTTGNNHTAVGELSAWQLQSGYGCVAIGAGAGSSWTSSESKNIAISNVGVLGESQTTRIGTSGDQLACYITGIDGVDVGSVATVVTEFADQLGTAVITGSSTITVTPGPNTITLTASGSLSDSFVTDSGTATPSAGVLNVITGNSTQHCGASVLFQGAGNQVNLTVTDLDANTLVGGLAGNATLSGSFNVSLGNSTLRALTSGSDNTIIGSGAAQFITSGANNIAVGMHAGLSWITGSESNNIVIGNGGVNAESSTIRIGTGGTQTACYIAGIDGVNVGSTATVVTEVSNKLGTAVITAGPGISVSTGANTITISNTGAAFTWTDETTAGPFPLVAENGYVADSVFTVGFTLPTSAAIGDTIRIMGKGSGGWTVTYAANQKIIYGNASSTLTTGSLSSTNINDCVELICSTASLTQPIFTVFSSIGNLSLT